MEVRGNAFRESGDRARERYLAARCVSTGFCKSASLNCFSVLYGGEDEALSANILPVEAGCGRKVHSSWRLNVMCANGSIGKYVRIDGSARLRHRECV